MTIPNFKQLADNAKIVIAEAHISSLQYLHKRRLRRNELAVAHGRSRISDDLIDRISRWYSSGATENLGDSMWVGINQQKRDVHEALLVGGEALRKILLDPGRTNFFLGFDSLFKDRVKGAQLSPNRQREYLMRQLIGLAESIGTFRLYHPECGPKAEFPPTDADEIIDGIEQQIGITIDFPNPFPDELGLKTRRGIAAYRAIHAVYQAWQLYRLSRIWGNRILEIGAGMGRTAYYASKMGLCSYTIVDIPLTSAAQAAFLGQALGPERVRLPGEGNDDRAVRLLNPGNLIDVGPVDIVLNADSLTEMDKEVAQGYADYIAGNAAVFLSINHEANQHRVRDLKFEGMECVSRSPHWMRTGYVEELYVRV